MTTKATTTRKFTKAERRILRALQAHPWLTIADLHKVCDLNRIYAVRVTKAMIDEGIIDRRMSMPTYALSDAGQQILDSIDNA
jgi:DNA-binding MarR family transcriptional regulator